MLHATVKTKHIKLPSSFAKQEAVARSSGLGLRWRRRRWRRRRRGKYTSGDEEMAIEDLLTQVLLKFTTQPGGLADWRCVGCCRHCR